MQLKSYTDLEQSKKLAEILPLESADMCLTFVNNIWNPVWGKTDDIYKLQKDCYEPDYTKDEYVDFDEFEPKVVPCWSLAALLNIIKIDYKLEKSLFDQSDYFTYAVYDSDEPKFRTYEYDNPIDACVEMIVKLKETDLL